MLKARAVWLAVALATVMVMASAVTAFAAPVVSLTTTRTVVTYPHGSWLDVAVTDADAAVPATVTIQYRPVGSDTWAKVRTVAASRTALGVVRVPVSHYPFLKKTTGFRALIEGAESDVTTISVKAKLSTPIAPASFKAGRTVVIKGFIWPRHVFGSRPVDVMLWKKVGGEWVLQDTVHPAIVSRVAEGNKWTYKFQSRTADKGWWRVQQTHEDAGHLFSASKYDYFKVR